MFTLFNRLPHWLGIEANRTSHREKWISVAGAILGIVSILIVNQDYLLLDGAHLIVASMGASAVLMFAVPHGALSQPWPVFGGHLLSAAIGVACQRALPGNLLTPALATGLAVGLMHYARCIHPPGGATALAAVVGGPQLHELGYSYLLTPILSNVLVILAVAVAFNALFPWRRYPATLSAATVGKSVPANAVIGLTQEDVMAALRARNSFVDVSAEELTEIFELALAHSAEAGEHPAVLVPGSHYSNGLIGRRWSIRQVIDEGGRPSRAMVVYKVVAGANAYETGVCRREEFMRWARFQVEPDGDRWARVRTPAA